jgi:hypothetical protein
MKWTNSLEDHKLYKVIQEEMETLNSSTFLPKRIHSIKLYHKISSSSV